MFERLRPLIHIGHQLERIAAVLEFFAIAHARDNNLMFIPSTSSRSTRVKDESELMHTDPAKVAQLRAEHEAILSQRGYPALEAEELLDE